MTNLGQRLTKWALIVYKDTLIYEISKHMLQRVLRTCQAAGMTYLQLKIIFPAHEKLFLFENIPILVSFVPPQKYLKIYKTGD